MTPVDWRALSREARERFGVRRFRPGQRELMEAVFDGRDALGILATGAGKSLCYQLPALFLPKATIVISPLLALMQDQKEKLEEAEIPAAKLDSTLAASEERKQEDEIARGRQDLVYVTPERFENPDFIDLMREAGVSLIVVDEAHCVSQWGHDFRPSYLSIRDGVRALGRPPVLALTATATPEVEEDIARQLSLERPRIVRSELERKNIFLEVRRTVNREMKQHELRRILDAAEGTGIVYVATVRTANELYEWLRGEGRNVGRYHGKLRKTEREEIQASFMAGSYDAIIATNAFGLGIDKPDIRFVAHWNFPASLEAYYQEVGRAGRDGKPSRAILLYRLEDKRVQSYFLGGKYPKREESLAIYEAVKKLAAEKRATAAAVTKETDLSPRRTKVVIAQLEAAGLVERKPRRIELIRDFQGADELDRFLSEYEERHSDDREKLEAMMHYAQAAKCRMQLIAEYFGEEFAHPCEHCDNCRARAWEPVPASDRADHAAVHAQ